MANTYIEEIEGEKCSQCHKEMELMICGALKMWTCFKCKEFKKEYNWIGRMVERLLPV